MSSEVEDIDSGDDDERDMRHNVGILKQISDNSQTKTNKF